MARNHILSILVTFGGVAALIATTAHSQLGPPKQYIALQPVTPGTSESGHAHVSGTIRASQLVGGGAGITGVNADLLDGLNSTAFLQSVPNPLSLVGASAPATIRGENTATTGSGVMGIASSNTGTVYGGYFSTQSQNGYGVFGSANWGTGATFGGYFHSASTGGIGVAGHAGATSGITSGGMFSTNSSTGRGVYGLALTGSGAAFGVMGETGSNSTGAAGVYGVSTTTNSVAPGVLGETESTQGRGVFGLSSNTSGTGVGGYFQSHGISGRAVYGLASHATGSTFGGIFVSSSSNGKGVYGQGQVNGVLGESDGYGVEGRGSVIGGLFTSNSSNGIGMRANLTSTLATGLVVEATFVSPTARGVQGDSDATTGTPYAIFGDTDGSGWALYASGNSGASGTKSFRIDHPLDPENKYLLHYSSESPVPQNFYVGNVVTDSQGYAWVQLPDYFDEINEDFKYQLTVIDHSDDFVLVKVVREIENNRFRIRTSKPNVKVSWRVDANRNDAYVRKYRPQEEVDKPEHERGLFEHPEIFGYGKERSFPYDQPGAKTEVVKRAR